MAFKMAFNMWNCITFYLYQWPPTFRACSV